MEGPDDDVRRRKLGAILGNDLCPTDFTFEGEA